MKYKAFKEQNGTTWFVSTHTIKGKKHGYRFDNELEAKQFALIQSMIYYDNMVTAVWDELKSISETNDRGDIKTVGSDGFYSKGDHLC